MKRLNRILLLFGASCAVFLTGCSTKKNTFISRNYHNLTAYYNIYWNGLQSLEEADNIIKEKSVDNYFEVIPVFKYGAPADTALVSKQTARMIEKSVTAVKKHSISIRGKEYVKTIDNAYLLMGKGFFYRQDYSKARSVFNFVLSEFAANPEHYEAMLWIARTYICEEDYSMATSFISQVEAQDEHSLMKQTYRDLPLVQAEYLIRQEKFREAVPYLQTGIQRCRNRDLKARLYFILGQIEQKYENHTQAYQYYRECLKLNPPLDLVFNARLNMALCFDGKNINGKDILKGLHRMLRDPKNSAYFGRIYYVMGEMAFRQNDEENAVRYMDLSISSSSNDPERMLMAARRLAFYFYDNRRYIESQKYYEIAAKVVAYDDPDYYDIITRAENLAELTVYYRRLCEADTLKQVGRMSKREQRHYAESKAKQYRAQQEALRMENSRQTSTQPVAGKSNWYFYNEQTKAAGLAEFTKKWGRRELEDMWFLSSKPKVGALRPLSTNNEDEEEVEEAPKVLTQADPEYYLERLPKTDSAYRALDSIIEPAFYYVGSIYCDKLGENREGEPYLVRLVSEYPASEYIPSACELLCKIYRQNGDMASFRKYADILANRFPQTDQNARVNNPDYFRDIEANAAKVEKIYEETYALFMRNDYSAVINRAEEIEKEFPVNAYREQFLYLKLISTAHVSGYKAMLPLARLFVTSYPQSPLTEKVKAAEKKAGDDLAKRIFSPESDPVIAEEPEPEENTAVADSLRIQDSLRMQKEYMPAKASDKHAILIVGNPKERDPGVMLLRVQGFNDKFYDDENLECELFPLDDRPTLYMIIVSAFPNLRAASNYKRLILNNDYVFGTLEEKTVVEIGERNAAILRETKRPLKYVEFYNADK